MDITKFKADLEAYLKKLAGVQVVGTIWFGIDPNSKPAGVQLYSGQLLSRAAYEAHSTLVFSGKRTVLTEADWQAYVAANGFCPYFSSGDGSTTYRFPLIKGVHPKFVSALAEAGQYVEAGLPNITGRVGNVLSLASGSQGACYEETTLKRNEGQNAGSSTGYNNIGLDASRSNPIYGNSDTVQPEAITMVVGEWVVGVAMPIGVSTAESLLASVTELESGKASTDLSNLTESGRRVAAGLGMPSGRSIELTLGAGGTTYTAPANGWVYFEKVAGATAYIQLVNVTTGISLFSRTTVTNDNLKVFLPVRAGDVFRVAYSATGDGHLWFIYAEGEEA